MAQSVGSARHRSVTVTLWPLAVSAQQLAALCVTLPADDQAHAATLHVATTAQQFIVSRSIMRKLLARECGFSLNEFVLRTDARGKPYVDNPPRPIAFNLSHSGGFGALAIGDVERVGIDIEIVPPAVDDLASSVFSAREALQFAEIPEVARPAALIRAWVAKEAYLKATGEGLGGGLDSLELEVRTSADILPVAIRGSLLALAQWQFQGFDVSDRIYGAVAVKSDQANVELKIHRAEVEHFLMQRAPE